jgi:predicted secreted protein
MQTKRIFKIASIILLMAIAMPSSASLIGRDSFPAANAQPAEDPRVLVLTQRLGEIKEADRTVMSSSEKKVMRKEVKSIKKQLKDLNKGVYLSVGAIIIIILLLILIL